MPEESGIDFFPPLSATPEDRGRWDRLLSSLRLRFRHDKRMTRTADGGLEFRVYEKGGYPDISLPADGLKFRRFDYYSCLSSTPYLLPSGASVEDPSDDDDDILGHDDEFDEFDNSRQARAKRARRDAEHERRQATRQDAFSRRFDIVNGIYTGVVAEFHAAFGTGRVIEWCDHDGQVYAHEETSSPSPPCASCGKGQWRGHACDKHEPPPLAPVTCASCTKGALRVAAELVVTRRLPAGTAQVLAAYFLDAPLPARVPSARAAPRPPPEICYFYTVGRCHFGSGCYKSHDASEHTRYNALKRVAAQRAAARAAGEDLSTTDDEGETNPRGSHASEYAGAWGAAFREWRDRVLWQRRLRRFWRTAQIAAATGIPRGGSAKGGTGTSGSD